MKRLAVAMVLLLALGSRAEAATYTFDFPISQTFIVRTDNAAPSQIRILANISATFPVFDWIQPSTAANYQGSILISVLDETGTEVPQIPSSPAGNDILFYGANNGPPGHNFVMSSVLANDGYMLVVIGSLFTSGNLLSFSSGLTISVNEGHLTNADLAPVPLPAALPLMAGALGGMGVLSWWRRRREKREHPRS